MPALGRSAALEVATERARRARAYAFRYFTKFPTEH